MTAPFSERHRAALERYAARGCRVSAYMLEHGVGFPEAVEELHRRLPGPAPVPEPDTEWR